MRPLPTLQLLELSLKFIQGVNILLTQLVVFNKVCLSVLARE